jgi:hypothetical protein
MHHNPKRFLGHDLGKTILSPTFLKFAPYWQLLAQQSNRMKWCNSVFQAGWPSLENPLRTPMVMAVISSPDNPRA